MKLDAEDIGEKTSVTALLIEALEEFVKKVE